MLVFILAAILATVAGAPTDPSRDHYCIHTNTAMISADNVIAHVMADMDNNTDHKMTEVEMIVQFIGKFDLDGDSKVQREEFVHNWHLRYNDVPEFADYLFDHFDLDNNGYLGIFDFPILHLLVDIDDDGIADEIEFTLYMLHLYEDCVPHYHKPHTK